MEKTPWTKNKKLISGFFLLSMFFVPLSAAQSPVALSSGGTVYVSVYSHIYSGPKPLVYQLAAILSIRNTDLTGNIKIIKADYYDTQGQLVKKYITEPFELGPLVSKYYYIKERDKTGGEGANFIVKWISTKKVNQPVIEAVMLGLSHGQGLSFICPGKNIVEHMD